MKRIGMAALLAVLMIWLGVTACAETVVGDPMARLRSEDVTYNGETYRPKRRHSTVLLMGTDHYADEVGSAAYRSGVQADFLMLLVFDDNAQTVTPVQINRDTLAPVTMLSAFGQNTGEWNTQICLAYSFGDGREESCKLTLQAVRKLLHNVTIDHYMALNLDAIPVINDALGGVTVTLADDFAAYDETMRAGETITLHGKQAEYYVRMRYGVGDESNLSRLERQRTFLEQAGSLLKQKVSESASFAENMLSQLQPYLTTDMARGRMINLGNSAAGYQLLPMVEMTGESRLGSNGFMEFTPDEDALMRMVLSVFYDKV